MKEDMKGITNSLTKEIFNKFFPRLFDFAYRFLKDEEQSKDVVQEAFIFLWKNDNGTAYDESEIKSFLYNAVKFSCLKIIRHQKVLDKFFNSYPFHLVEEEKITSQIIHSEILGEIHHAIKNLPKGCAAVFRLGYLDGLNNQEIATTLNISINTVKSQKLRALYLLRKKLSPQTLLLLSSAIANFCA